MTLKDAVIKLAEIIADTNPEYDQVILDIIRELEEGKYE